MPAIHKQSPTKSPSNGRKAQTGSILDQAIPVSELEDDFIKIVLYGANRVGKTWLSCDFPKPLLLISFEPCKTGGAKTVKKVPGVTYLPIKSLKAAVQLAGELSEDTTYKTHVLDTATSLQDLILQELLNLPKLPEQLNWGMVSEDQYRQRSEKTREALRPFLELDAHTVICAKERDHNAHKGDRKPKITRGFQIESFLAADLGGATVGWLHDACDYIARLSIEKETEVRRESSKVAGKMVETEEEVETGKIVRRLRTMYHPNYAAGFRSCDPSAVPDYIDEPTFSKIKSVIDGKKLG